MVDRAVPARVSSYGGEMKGRFQTMQAWDLHIADEFIMKTTQPGLVPFMWEVADAWNQQHGLGRTPAPPRPKKQKELDD